MKRSTRFGTAAALIAVLALTGCAAAPTVSHHVHTYTSVPEPTAFRV